MMLSLAEAVKTNRSDEFFAQEEARCFGPVDRGTFDASTMALVKAPQSEDYT